MRFRKSQLALAVVAIAAVLALAVTLLVSGGVVEALLMIVVVAGLAGMYLLRRYARAELLYRRRSGPHRRHPEGEPSSSARAADPEDVTSAGRASTSDVGGVRERRVPDRL
jgi:hypothetical protein